MAIEQVSALDRGAHFSRFVEQMRATWRQGQDATLPARAQPLLEALLRESPRDEAWSALLLREQPVGRELYRDSDFGFIQMGHYHNAGHGGSPHDHGPYWVLYGVYSGEIEITRYRRVDGGMEPGPARLEIVATERLPAGTVKPYLRGEIHATRAIAPEGSVVMRFLSADIDAIERFRYKPLDRDNQPPTTGSPRAGSYQAIFGR
jgi:hypothetical protein